MHEQIVKYYQGELGAEERLDLLRKSHSDKSLKKEFIRMQQLQALLGLVAQENDQQEATASYHQFRLQHKRAKILQFAQRTLRYAATIIILISATWTTADFYYTKHNSTEELFNTVYVPAGQRLSLTLHDGTVVWLNAQTTITYPAVFSNRERRVSIEGEAFFEVAKDAKKPFIVSTGTVDAKVLGTAFNVFNYPEENYSRISLIEGSLQVYHPESQAKAITLRPNEEITVSDSRLAVSNIADYKYFLWKDGLYSFENESFENIIKRLELYYAIDIEVKDSAMLQWKYTVKFRQKDGIHEILRLMQRVHPFAMKNDDENNRIIIR
ncbi:anti-sigma factor [Bacteroidia bacterium]|nr:anti-sigma factor [Bacteroidia bacterium]